jgi:putative transposase
MDGKGRWIDNVMIERFWRTIKYEDIYLKSYCSPNELEHGIAKFTLRYNSVRAHKTLDRLTPDEVYGQKLAKIVC